MLAAIAAILGVSEVEVLADISLVIAKVVADIFHHRSVDPAYLAKSDSVFAQWGSAKTEDEKNAAQIALRALMAQ